MSELYKPELGQMLWGQPNQEWDCDSLFDAAINYLAEELERVLGNVTQDRVSNPFHNSGARFDTEGLSVHAYSWGDDEQPWNLKCGDVEVSWYKWAGRGMSVNKRMTPDDTKAFLEKALSIIRACEGDYFDRQAGQKFTYCGKVYQDD